MDPAAFGDPEELLARHDLFVTEFSRIPAASDSGGVVVPGTPERRAETETASGIAILDSIVGDLTRVSEMTGVPLPQHERSATIEMK